MAVCPRCGERSPDRARFCPACGFALAVAPPEPRAGEELKTVTAVFVDLVSFTARAELLDPEDVARVLRPYQSRVREALERFGGGVEKFIGDAVMAVFGAPAAREDDPERAVLAAFAVREAIGELNAAAPELDLQIRIGVNTGEALVSPVRPGEGEGLVAGDVVNVAARLQAAAPAGGILVGEATCRATARCVDYGPPQEVDAKGKRRPVRAREALAVRPRHAVDLARRGFAPLVGRAHELALLVDTVLAARDSRTPRVLTLVGPPGIGKTRLLWELFHTLDEHAEGFLWRQGRSLAYGEGVTYWAFAEIVKAQAAILDSDSAPVAQRKLRRCVEAVLADSAEQRWVEGHLRPLAGLGGRALADDRRGEAFAAWTRFVEALASVRPLVLVLEDLQWANDGLLDFVTHLTEATSDLPLALVCTAREELLERRPAWRAGERLLLEPLSTEDTSELLEALREGAELPPGAAAGLGPRTAGNPLYAEEYVRMLAERGVAEGELPLPDTIGRVVAARLDTLGPAEKGVLQDAAVLGQDFWTGAVASLSGHAPERASELLDRLRTRRLVRPQPRTSVEGEEQYAFWHALVQEVAYAQIPRARRAEKHRLAAEWIAELAPDRSEAVAEMLAHHYTRAIEYARVSGVGSPELAGHARVALLQAGDRALDLYAFAAAARFYAAAHDLTPRPARDRPRLLLRLGSALFWGEGRGERELEEAAAALLAAGDLEATADATVLLSRLALTRGEPDRGLALARRAVELLDGEAGSESQARALSNLSGFLMVGEDAAGAVQYGSRALELASAPGLEDLRAHALNNLGVARALLGDTTAGIAELEQSIAVAEATGSPESVRGYVNLGSLLANLGELERAFGLYARGAEAATRFGDARGRRWFETERVWEHYWHGESEQAERLADEVLVGSDDDFASFDCRVVRTSLRLLRGDSAGALAEAAIALEFGRGSGDRRALLTALAVSAHAAASAGEDPAPQALEALALWDEKAPRAPGSWLAPLAFAVRAAELGDELLSREEGAVGSRWLDAACHVAAGRAPAAAAEFERIGSAPDAAFARQSVPASSTEARPGRRPRPG